MTKISCLLALALFSFGAMADYRCERGGGTIVNLPERSNFLDVKEVTEQEIVVTITERSEEGGNGQRVLRETFFFDIKDLSTLKTTYKSEDEKMFFVTYEGVNNIVHTARLSGKGKGLDKRKAFVFEARNCKKSKF